MQGPGCDLHRIGPTGNYKGQRKFIGLNKMAIPMQRLPKFFLVQDIWIMEVPDSLPNIHPEMASFSPRRRSRFFAILNVVPLRLRLQKSCGLALNRNLPFLDGHYLGRHSRFRFSILSSTSSSLCGSRVIWGWCPFCRSHSKRASKSNVPFPIARCSSMSPRLS